MPWFDAHATDYDAWYTTPLGRYVDSVEKELLAELAEPHDGETALDIGCGTGNHTLWLAEQGLRVTGLDESRPMLEVAAAKSADLPVEWVHSDATELPFGEETFDLVVSVAAMEFIEQRRAVLREAMRLLRPGGRLVLGLLTRDSAWGELYRNEAETDPGSVFAKAHLFTEDELPGLLDEPFTLRKGLYHPPDPVIDRGAAEVLEGEMQALQADGAGFLAVRWVKGERS